MKKFNLRVLIAVLMVCIMAFSLMACNPTPEPEPEPEEKTYSAEKSEAITTILQGFVGPFSQFGSIGTKVISLDLSARLTNNPTGSTSAVDDYTVVVKGNIDITGGNDTSLMIELINNNIAVENEKLVFGAYYNDTGADPDSNLYLILKNDKDLTGDIFGADKAYITGKIKCGSIKNLVSMLTSSSGTEPTIDMSAISLDTIVAALAGFCLDPVDPDPSLKNPYIKVNGDGSKDVNITIDLASVMTMARTMGGALTGFIVPDSESNNIKTLSQYFQAVGLYVKEGANLYKPLSNTNLPACTGLKLNLSAKIDADSNIKTLGAELENPTAFDFVIGVPKTTYDAEVTEVKTLLDLSFTAGKAKLSLDTVAVGQGKSTAIANAIEGKITEANNSASNKYCGPNATNVISVNMQGEVSRYNKTAQGAKAEGEEKFDYTIKTDVDLIGIILAGVYSYNNLKETEKNEAGYRAVANNVMATLRIAGCKLEYKMTKKPTDPGAAFGSGELDTYLYFDSNKINTIDRVANIEFYTTSGANKYKSIINVYDLIDYGISAAVYNEKETNAATFDFKSILFNTLKSITTAWGSINFIDENNEYIDNIFKSDKLIKFTEFNKNLKEVFYTLFKPTDGTKASLDTVIDVPFGGKDYMAISIDSITFGDVNIEKATVEGFTGDYGTCDETYDSVSAIQVGQAFQLKNGETDVCKVKIMDYIVTGRTDDNKVTQVKVIVWKCNNDGVIIPAGGVLVLTLNGTDMTIKDVNGNVLSTPWVK